MYGRWLVWLFGQNKGSSCYQQPSQGERIRTNMVIWTIKRSQRPFHLYVYFQLKKKDWDLTQFIHNNSILYPHFGRWLFNWKMRFFFNCKECLFGRWLYQSVSIWIWNLQSNVLRFCPSYYPNLYISQPFILWWQPWQTCLCSQSICSQLLPIEIWIWGMQPSKCQLHIFYGMKTLTQQCKYLVKKISIT